MQMNWTITGDVCLLSICTGILGIFDILQFEISSLMNWIFFLVWKQTGYFYQFKLDFFPSSWARVKYFDGPCITIYSLFTIYRDIHYQLLVWWIHYTHCCESKKWKPGKFHLCSLWNDIFNCTLTGTLDFANLIFQTGIFSRFKLGKTRSKVLRS